MKQLKTQLAGVAKALSAAAVLGFAAQAGAAEITWDRLLNADKDPNNWLMYHGSFKGWHYSALDQINKNNVKNLSVAWMHTPSASKRGIQSFPLVADGILYYTSSTGQVWALDGASRRVHLEVSRPRSTRSVPKAPSTTPTTAAWPSATARSTSARSTAA